MTVKDMTITELFQAACSRGEKFLLMNCSLLSLDEEDILSAFSSNNSGRNKCYHFGHKKKEKCFCKQMSSYHHGCQIVHHFLLPLYYYGCGNPSIINGSHAFIF
jgi:hypothetical protein